MNKVYTVIVDSDKLKCYDTQDGSLQGTLTFIGKVVNGPVVTGDRVTVVLETASGRQGRIYGLPLLNAVSTFNVN
jgi:hypothetical protein